MKIEFNTGNFKLEVQGEFGEAAKEKALESALKYILQRDVATKVYTALAGVKGKKAEKVLPEGFERESIAFTKENAEAFEEEAMEQLTKLGRWSLTVTQYVKGEGKDDAGKLALKKAEEFIAKGKGDVVAAKIKEVCGFVVENAEEVAALAKGITALDRHFEALKKAAAKSALGDI